MVRTLAAAFFALIVLGLVPGADDFRQSFGQERTDEYEANRLSQLRRRLRSRRMASSATLGEAPRLRYSPLGSEIDDDYVVVLDGQEPEVVATETLPGFSGEPLPGGPMISGSFATGEYCFDDCCTVHCRQRRFGIFGEAMYLQPGDSANVAYAVPVDGCGPNALPAGPVGIIDPDYDTGFRLGFVYLLKGKSAIVGTYTWYENSAQSRVAAAPPNVVRSLVTHPGTLSCAANSLETIAAYNIEFQHADFDYRHEIRGNCYSSIDYLLGVRFGELEQRLQVDQTIGLGVTSVSTNIDFKGTGLRMGLAGETHPFCGPFLVYGRGLLNVLVGEFKADYLQFNSFAQTQAITSWKDDRLVPVVEWELGVGTSREMMGAMVRLTAGYNLTAWYNTVTTGEYIGAVQSFDYRDVGDTLTFSGLVGRAEVIF